MSKKLDGLEKRLKELEEKIKETKNRLPAHSTKPLVMIDLLTREDEHDDVLKKIGKIKNK